MCIKNKLAFVPKLQQSITLDKTFLLVTFKFSD